MGTLRELRRWKTHWTLFLTLVITIAILACGDDATPTPAQAPAATAAPTSPAPTAGAMATPNAGTRSHSYSCQAGSYRRSYGNPKTNPCCSANSNAHAGTRRFSSGRRWKYTSFCQ